MVPAKGITEKCSDLGVLRNLSGSLSLANEHYNPSNIFARARLVQTRHVTEYSPTKTGEYQRLVYTKTVDSVKRAR